MVRVEVGRRAFACERGAGWGAAALAFRVAKGTARAGITAPQNWSGQD